MAARRQTIRAFAFALALGSLASWAAVPSLAAGHVPPTEGFADLVERLTPAVVNIASTLKPSGDSLERPGSGLEDIPRGAPGDEFFHYFGQNGTEGQSGPGGQDGEPPDGGGEVVPAASLGSGFIIDPAGLVVTNNHVIADSEDISVVLDDGSRLKARVIGRDLKTDLALLKVEAGRPLPHVEFGDSDQARVGDWVIAIGNPFGLGNSVTAGIVSARGRDINAGPYDDFLQTDAPINRGNSGGPMFNLDGTVIGVNTLIYSPSGGSVGIGFATPAAIVKPVIEQLKKYGGTRRGWIGVRIQSVSEELAHKLGLAQVTGALVAGVIDSGPAQAAGLKAGDVILKFDGKPITSRRALPRLAADTEVGRTVDIVIWRERKEVTLKIGVARLEEYEKKEAALLEGDGGRLGVEGKRGGKHEGGPKPEVYGALGVTLAELDPVMREHFGLSPGATGVVVTAIDGTGGDESLAPGDLIVELDRHVIASLKDVRAALRARDDGGPVVVLRQRAEEREFVVIEPRHAAPKG